MEIMDVLRTPFQLDTGSCGRAPNIVVSLKCMDVKIQYFAAKKGQQEHRGLLFEKWTNPSVHNSSELK